MAENPFAKYAEQDNNPFAKYLVKEPSYDPTAGMSAFERFAAGMGKGVADLGRGIGQRLGLVDQATIDEARRLDAPLARTTAGTIGNFAGQAAAALPAAFIPGANTMVGSALLGGALGAAQPTAENESALVNTAFGAGGGMAGKYAADKILRMLQGSGASSMSGASSQASATPGVASASTTVSGGATARGTGGGYNFGTVGEDVSAGLNAPTRAAMERGRDLGMQLTPGQASGSRALQQLEAKLESQPMTSGQFNAIKANNATVLNRAAANAIGETADTVDSAVLAQAHDRIGNVYRMVADQRPRAIDPDQFLTRLSGVEREYEGLLPVNISDNPLVRRLFGYAERGQATGEQLQDIASKLGKAAHSNMTSANGDRQLGMALNEVRDIADDFLAQGLNGRTAALFNDARGQYRNLMLLTQRTGVLNPTTGNVNGNALASLLQQKDKAGFLRGGNDTPMYDAARFAQAFRPIVGDSGTATRMPLPSPTDFVLSLPFNLATRAYTSSPAVNLAASAGNILRNGLAPELGGLLDPLLPLTGGAMGGLLGSRLAN